MRRAAAGMRSRKRGLCPERSPVYMPRGARVCSARCSRLRSFSAAAAAFAGAFASLSASRCAARCFLASEAAARCSACAASRCLLASQPLRSVVGSFTALQPSRHKSHSMRRSYSASLAISSLFRFSPKPPAARHVTTSQSGWFGHRCSTCSTGTLRLRGWPRAKRACGVLGVRRVRGWARAQAGHRLPALQ